ncbi:MAG: 16S rRNA (guanine(527)-N(7))-methyltransferase RsmG, partial [Candidatus Muirbacterium halophilum]|nr:16S rRNA (guanine(527)-N(7))-methyltransferase RsmG [Candidatus Muirbacterium halophilum]
NKIVDKFTEFISLLIEENTKYNLASIKDIDVFLEKTFIDSLIPLKYLGNIKGNLIDIGSGNGFPGVILGIVCEDLNVVLCDAETKKIRFLDKACELLGNRFQTLHGRAEDNISYFNKFDFVCAKALVSKADKWLKWTIPYLAPNGISVNYKTKVFNDDLELAVTKSYMKKKKCELIHSIPYKVADVEREVFFIRKLCTKKI